MARFLKLTEQEQRLQVAIMLGLSPNHQETWPLDTIDRLISEVVWSAHKTAEEMLRMRVMQLMDRGTRPR